MNFSRFAFFAMLLATSHGFGQSIRPREVVLPYQADVQSQLASAVVQADGSWLASGQADASLNITFAQNGDVRQIEHVRAPFVTEFDYGFPAGSKWHRERLGQLVRFDYLVNTSDDGLYDSGCRIRVAPPSRIDFYSAACGQIGITDENSYLWFRVSDTVSRLIRRVDGVELWNQRFFDIPDYGRFRGIGAVFFGDRTLVYGHSSLVGPIAIQIDRDGQTQWISAFPAKAGAFAQGDFADASFDAVSQQFIFWFKETDVAFRMYRLNISGQMRRSDTLLPSPLGFDGASAIVLKASPTRLERIEGDLGTILWSQPVTAPVSDVCRDIDAIYLSATATLTLPSSLDSMSESATVEKFQIADGASVYRHTASSSGPRQSLFCDQGQAFLQTTPIDEPRVAPLLTTFNAQGSVQWQRPFPPVPREANDTRLVSNRHGDMVVQLALNSNIVALPIRYQLSYDLVRGYTQVADRFESLVSSSAILADEGSLSRVVITDTKEKGFDYRFEQRDVQGNVRWQLASPYRSQMQIGQASGGGVLFSPTRVSPEFGLPIYSLTPQGALHTDQVQGDSLGRWVNVGTALDSVVRDGTATSVLRFTAGAAPSYETIPGVFGEVSISGSGDVFALKAPQATVLKKYERSNHQWLWEFTAPVLFSDLTPDGTGGIWAKTFDNDPNTFVSAVHLNANGHLLSDSSFSSRIVLEGQVCEIIELHATSAGAIGFGSIAGGRCVFWLDARGDVMDGVLLPGVYIKNITQSMLYPETVNVLARRQNVLGLFEVVVQTLQRENFRNGFE